MMRSIRTGGLMVLTLAIVLPAAARAAKLDDEDRDFLLTVEPIILDHEEGLYKKLKDKSDRIEFQKIFWARRDPNPRTPRNEFRDAYMKAKDIAAQRYAVLDDPRPGWTNECGRLFILLGEPDQVDEDARWGTKRAGRRMPETWTYRDRPGQTFAGGRQEVTLSDECRGNKTLDNQLDRIAASKVVQPNLDYRMDKKGHLVKLIDLLPKDSAARALIETPRQDFPIAAQAAYLRVAGGGTGVFGLVRGDAATLSGTGSGGVKSLSLSLAVKAVAEDGTEAGWSEEAINAPVGADGSFLASFKMGLKPGNYTLSVGALDLKSHKGSLASLPIEVPNFSQVEAASDGAEHPVPSISSLFLLRSVEEMPVGAAVDPASLLGAFTLGTLRLQPYFGTSFHKDQEVSVLYQVYDLATAPGASADEQGKAEGIATLRIRKDGKLLKDRTTNRIATPVGGSVVGPIALGSYDPGRYQIEVKLLDKVAQRTVTREAWFEVLP